MADAVDVAIVGAGAAGLTTAIFAARLNPNFTIVALDSAQRLGAKILVSGGGRCNITNVRVTPADFFGGSPHVVRRVLSAFTVDQTVAFFRELGVPLHVEDDGKLFPDSNRARTVVDALLGEAERLGIRLLTGRRVTAIARDGDQFEMGVAEGAAVVGDAHPTPTRPPTSASEGRRYVARRVVLATGGLSLPKTGSDGSGHRLAQALGHALVPPTPALVPFVLSGDFHRPLSGVSQDVELTIRAAGDKPVRLRGALLWTHFGVSGPVVLNASRFWHRAELEQRSVTVSASFLPGDDFAAAERRLLELSQSQPRLSLQHALGTLIPARVAEAVLQELGIAAGVSLAQLARESRRRLVHALLEWPLPVTGSRGYNHAEVTAGGVPLAELDPATMESRKCPGLFLVGEILDVDGRIGGFNFQWAWSSAWVAAQAVAAAK